jgi:hypothetical protein
MVVAIAGTVFHLVSGAALLESALGGIESGLVLFLTWALGRELDPDHDLAAFVGAGVVLIASLLVDPPSLLVVLWLLLVLRTVNRTVGLPAKLLDSLAVFGLGVWLALQGVWTTGLITAAVFLLDGLLSLPLRRHLFASVLALVITVALYIFYGDFVMEDSSTIPVVIASVVAAGLFLVVIATSGELRAVGDATRRPLNPRRVQAAQALALLTALLFAWGYGASGVAALLPLWAAMFGVSLYRLAILAQSRGR